MENYCKGKTSTNGSGEHSWSYIIHEGITLESCLWGNSKNILNFKIEGESFSTCCNFRYYYNVILLSGFFIYLYIKLNCQLIAMGYYMCIRE